MRKPKWREKQRKERWKRRKNSEEKEKTTNPYKKKKSKKKHRKRKTYFKITVSPWKRQKLGIKKNELVSKLCRQGV